MRHTTVLRADDQALVAEGFAALWHGHVDFVGTVGDDASCSRPSHAVPRRDRRRHGHVGVG